MTENHTPSIAPLEVIEAFNNGAITALQEMMQIGAYATTPPTAAFSDCTVSATIRLLRANPGILNILLPLTTAMQLAAHYLPTGTILTDEIINDVAGELANMVAGQAKTMLKHTPYHFTLTTPDVIRAAKFKPPHSATVVSSIISDIGHLLIVVDLSPCPGA